MKTAAACASASSTDVAAFDLAPRADRLPVLALLAMAGSAFVTILTEALPAGVLPQIAASLQLTQALAGQLVTAYAVGCVVATIPLASVTRGARRRPLLLLSLAGFTLVNAVTALADRFDVILVARFLAGAISGLLWSQLAGYASRISPPRLQGRAIALAMSGIPAALSLGVPAGTLLGAVAGWRLAFGAMSALSMVLIAWILVAVPDVPGERATGRRNLAEVLRLRGMGTVLLSMVFFVLAHNALYTYVAPLAALAGLGHRVDALLLVFGGCALAGMWVTGALIDGHLSRLTVASIALFGLAALAMGLAGKAPAVFFIGTAAWGLAFGGTPALVQTASARVSGPSSDVAQSFVVTTWNAAIAGAGVLGGWLLDRAGAAPLPWAALLLLAISIAFVLGARRLGEVVFR